MSIPVIPEHKKNEGNCIGCPHLAEDVCKLEECPDCAPDCQRCLAIKWAQYIVSRCNGKTFEDTAGIKSIYALSAIPLGDYQNIKRLAEEETHG